MKIPNLVKEWLTEFKGEKDGYSKFNLKYFGNNSLYTKLVKCLENKLEVESICHQIYSLGLSKDQKLNLLLLDMLPNILSFYLNVSTQSDNGKRTSDDCVVILSSCLLSLRNILISRLFPNNDNAFNIPIFTDGSIYHSPVVRPDLEALNESIVNISGKTSVNERSSLYLFPDLIKIYNYHICNYSDVSLINFCNLSSQIVSLNSVPRMDVSSILLLELTVGIYFIIFKQEHTTLATDALTDIECRADHELMTDVITVICSIRNHLKDYTAGQLFDCQIPIFNARRNRANSVNDIITNANFKPEKVSEDIETINIMQVNNNSSHNDAKAEIDLRDIGINLGSNKPTSNAKNKFKIKFSVGEHPDSNGDINVSKIDNNRVID